MAFVIFVDGDMEGVEPENGTTFNYKELHWSAKCRQNLVKGLIVI